MYTFTQEDLENLQEGSLLYGLIRIEMKRLGRWKNKPRGVPQKKTVLNGKLATANTSYPYDHQSSTWKPYKDDDFSEGI